MAKYRINGGTYEVDDKLAGDDLNNTLQQLADYTANQNKEKFLDFLGKSEGADFDTIVGGRQKITDFSNHPNVVGMRTADGPSTAAGKFQITGTTWREFAPQVGAEDFSPQSQKKVALAIIDRSGASDDVASGNFNTAISKLGGRWSSLPSSRYNQPKRSQAWVDQQLAMPYNPADPPAPAAQEATTYTPFAKVIPKADPATLSQNPDWLKASAQIYSWKERKAWQGADSDLADYGKSVLGYFNSNVVAMTADAAGLAAHGTQEDKNAFLYMMDQYDDTQASWEGAGRAALGMVTDPTNLIGLGTLGTATVAKVAASTAAKEGVKKLLLTSLGRTGIQAGILGGIQGATVDTVRQATEVTAGRKDSIGVGEVAGHGALGVAGGLVLGTAGDALLSVAAPLAQKAIGRIASAVKGKPASARIEPHIPEGIPEPMPAAPPAASTGEARAMADATAGEAPPVAHVGESRPDPAHLAGDLPPDPARTAPISTVLTADEIATATQRGQKGRLWDDLPFVGPLDSRAVQALVIPQLEGDMRHTAVNMADLTTKGESVAAQLRVLDDSTLAQSLEVLRGMPMTSSTQPVIFRAVQILHDETRVEMADLIKRINLDPASPKVPEWTARIAELEPRIADIGKADDAMGSLSGSLNRQRQEGLAGLQGSTVESIMAEHGLPRPEAEKLWQEMVVSSQSSSQAKKVEADYAARTAAAFDRGDVTEAANLAAMKRRELNGMAEEAAPHGSTFLGKLHSLAGGIRELMISNLFTAKTVLINLVPAAVKTVALPMAKYLVGNPLEKAAIAELGAHYAAMGTTVKGALVAARTAFKYEQSILTRDSGRIMEGEMTMTGRLGGGLRFFPRVLNASDEFLSQLNYAGYVAGKAASKTTIEGTAKGMTGKLLDDYVANGVQIAKASMFEGDGDALIQPIVNKGVNLGYTGEALQKYVEAEAVKSPEALRHGADKGALDFTRDVLYKRPFSGGNPGDGFFKREASGGAQGIEKIMRGAPEFSILIGQLFFRTPIRVFEEGIRMTPGVQLLAPGFMRDLAGVNGQMRQVRAQAESMMSLSIAGAALSLYASGNITGSGVYNSYLQDRARKDGPSPEPYTIKFKDGSTWSFKNMDPISTPLKILMNAFEGMDELKIKEAQEQYVNKPAYKLIMARITVATMAIAAAVTDANLVAGAKGFIDFGKELADPEGDEAAIVKKLGSELGMLVPNTLHKIAQTNDPRMRDPATFFQAIETRLGHNLVGTDDVKTSFAYDPLGQVREMADVGSMWNIFSLSTQEERIRGHSEEHQKVMLEFERLAQETGAIFAAPTPKNPMTGDLDLRTMMTADKTETMFDRWQRNYRDLNPDKVLLPIATSGAPDGTFKQKGMKVEMLQSQMKELQDIAFQQLLTDERIRDRLILETRQKARGQSGLLDFGNRDK